MRLGARRLPRHALRPELHAAGGGLAVIPNADAVGAINLAAADSDNITLSGSKVTAWADTNGSGLDFTQGSDTYRPTWASDLVTTANTPLYLKRAAGDTEHLWDGTGGTLVMLLDPDAIVSGSKYAFANAQPGFTAGVYMLLTGSGTDIVTQWRVSDGATEGKITAAAGQYAPSGAPMLIIARSDSSGHLRLRINGADVTAVAFTAWSLSQQRNDRISAAGYATETLAYGVDGDWRSIAFIPSAWTDEQCDACDAWAVANHGLTLL